MLIKSIKAQNFMKYQYVEIGDLPSKGIFGIFGENESGKSTIGEAVSFALFGATARFLEQSLTQLINWDSDQCEVKLTFLLEENQQYSVVRSIDRKGNQKVALYKGKKEVPIKTGVADVNREIERLTRFNFQNFRYTFYLVQKEIDVIQEVRDNAQEVVHKMLGFELLAEASDVLQKENEQARSRKDKCENELLVTRSLANEVKGDSTAEKNLATQIEELQERKKQMEEELGRVQSTIAKSEVLIETRRKLTQAFATLERSFNYNFHKEKLAQALQSLSHIYAAAREEVKALGKLTEKNQKQQKALEQKLEEIANLEKRLEALREIMQTHRHRIQKLVAFPEKASEAKENLQVALREKEQHRSRAGKAGLLLLAMGTLTFFTTAISLMNSLWWGALWLMVGMVSLVATLFILWGIFILRGRLKALYEEQRELIAEIEKFQKEVEICLNFPYQNLSQLEGISAQIDSRPIREEVQSLRADFSEIFSSVSDLMVFKKDHELKKSMYLDQQSIFDRRLRKMESLIKVIESLGKDVDITTSISDEDQKLLKNLEDLEQKVYKLLEEVQEHRAGLRDFDSEPPLEVDVAWQEYEGYRARYRNLSGISSIGGGTGMLKRIQSAYQKTSSRRLSDILNSEKETFFSTISSEEELQAALERERESEARYEKELANCLTLIKERELQYDKCIEELERKKNLISKMQALNRQVQDLEHTILVNQTTIEFLKQTMASVNSRFAPSISRVMSRVLSRFTKGRYQKVQVSENLVLKAYSQEKNDFVELAELSGGTVDQIFLSLRLAFAQAVLTAKLGSASRQFLFFDEPILSFDEERSTSFLTLLSEYKKTFAQVFVISPRPYPSEFFDLIINTSLNDNELVVSGNEPSSPHFAETKLESLESEHKEGGDEDDLRIEYDEGQ